jgi:hypothetical protein
MTMSLMKRPSAWVPIAMSLSALALVLAHVAIFGPAREADEGTPAHLFHLLMAGQVPGGRSPCSACRPPPGSPPSRRSTGSTSSFPPHLD